MHRTLRITHDAGFSRLSGLLSAFRSAVIAVSAPPRKARLRVSLALAFTLGLAGASAQAASSKWTVKDLGSIGGNYSNGYAVNDLGQVTGDAATPSGLAYHAFLYNGHGMIDISPVAQWTNLGSDINKFGHIVGFSSTSQDQNAVVSPFLYKDGVMSFFGSGGGSARSINDAGQIAGSTNAGRAFLYENGLMKDLGTLGGRASGASKINNHGQIVGNSDTAGGEIHGFIYENGAMRDLGTFPGGRFSSAAGINDKGQVVGQSDLPNSFETHAYLYSGGRMIDLGTLGGAHSQANAINNAGQVVGISGSSVSEEVRPFLYSDGKMVALSALPGVAKSGWLLLDATGINNKGQIVGRGYVDGNIRTRQHAYLLTPPAVKDASDCDDDGEQDADQGRGRGGDKERGRGKDSGKGKGRDKDCSER
ncbi:hypothetical protein BH11PSE11_BH11PSE11_38470 [soil metagenome]